MHKFTFDGEVETRDLNCPMCNLTHPTSTGFVLDHGGAFAIYFCKPHPETAEVFLEVTFGTFAEDETDRIRFACRFGPVEGAGAGSMLLTPQRATSAAIGAPLDREDALAHPRIDDFWDVSDWILLNDPAAHPIYHAAIKEGSR